jgi:4-hydroxy-2-oxoheptanedioate aldolase
MPQLRQSWLRPKLAVKPHVIGTFLTIPSPAIMEILGLAGFDFVVIDCEHGSIDYSQTEELIRAAATTGVSPIVRVPKVDPVAVRLPFDMGAVGIHIPQVESAADAGRAARYARFHPEGERGMQPYVRAASFRSRPTPEYLAESNREVVVIPHLEGLGGIRDLRAIAATPGIDVCFIGPYDLSQALGIPGEVNDPRIDDALRNAVQEAGAGTIIGTYADSPEAARHRLRQGVRYLTVSLDAALLLQSASHYIHEIDRL